MVTKTAANKRAPREAVVFDQDKISPETLARIPPGYQLAVTSGDNLVATALREKVAIDQLEKLLAMRKDLRAEAARAAFHDAMAAFQAECPVIKKNKTARVKDKFSYTYADLGSIVKQTKPLLKRHGFSFRIELEYKRMEGWKGGVQTATCIVTHVLGHSERSEFTAPLDSEAVVNDMQKAAAAGSFAKRQAFNNAFGILTSDEDNDAGNVTGTEKTDGQQAQGPREAAPAPAAAKPGTGDMSKPMPENKLRILRARLTSAGISDSQFEAQFKKPLTGMMDGDFDRVQVWVREMVEARAG